jgi:hypothetical protein
MSLLDSILGNTVGVLWRAGSGTVDPWTKANQIETETQSLIAAGMDPAAAAAKAQADVTGALSAESADPTQAQNGLSASLSKFRNYIILAVVVVAAIYLGGKYLEGGRGA